MFNGLTIITFVYITTVIIWGIILNVGVQYCLSVVYLVYYQTLSFQIVYYGQITRKISSRNYITQITTFQQISFPFSHSNTSISHFEKKFF